VVEQRFFVPGRRVSCNYATEEYIKPRIHNREPRVGLFVKSYKHKRLYLFVLYHLYPPVTR